MADCLPPPPLRIEAHPDVVVRIVGYVSEAECAERHGTATAYAARIRRDLAATGEELAAVKAERDGLRARVRDLERNVTQLGRAGGDSERAIESEVRRRLDRIMRERPRPRG